MVPFTEYEASELRRIADDEITRSALRRLFIEPLNMTKVLDEMAGKLPADEELGAHLRAVNEGIRMIERGFKELDKYKSVEKTKEKTNNAR